MVAADADGAIGDVGPAFVFTGRWPWEVNSAPPSGPITASTSGNPADGSATSSVDIALYPAPHHVQCYGEPAGSTNCEAPGGFGPSPVEGDSLHAECRATQFDVSGWTELSNAQVARATLAGGKPTDIVAIPDRPPANYTVQGQISNLGENFTVVFNEQIWHPDGSLTVNGVHLYMFGPTAVGGLTVGQVTCGTNPAPAPPPDRDPPTCGVPEVTVRGPADPTPTVPRTEFVGVFDTGGLQSIDHVRVINGTVTVGDPNSTEAYRRFIPGQTGPLRVVAVRSDESLPMAWSFDATDTAGNTIHCTGVQAPPPAVSESPSSITAGSPVGVTWSDIASPTATDWVGLYDSSGAADPALLAWTYTNGAAGGTVNLTVPVNAASGSSYELRLFSNNTYTRLATSSPFSVVASATTVSASPSTVNAGGQVTATWSGIGSPTPTDWVGLYDSSGAGDPALLAWAYTSGTASDSVNLTVPVSAAAGSTYELRLFANNTYTRLATSSPFSVVASATTISASPSTVAAGSAVTGTWSGIASPSATDWVGLYSSSSAADPALVAWGYTGGGASGAVNVTVPVNAAAGGTYELRLFSNNTYTRLATSSPFAVTASAATLSASPASVARGSAVTATWSGIASPTPTDWVGLYANSTDPAPAIVAWAYTGGTASGSLSLTVPAGTPPGNTYELRLFTNNTYTRLATSAPFSVT